MNEGRNESRGRSFIPGILIGCIGGVAFILVSTVLKQWLIIRYGIRIYAAIRTGTIWFGIGGIIVAIALSVPSLLSGIRRRQELARDIEQQRQETQILTDYSADSENPDKVRKRLAQLQLEMPALEWLTRKCREQMDEMDSLQARQKLLIETNAAIYLQDTVDLVDNIEREICLSYREIVNLCIAAGSADNLDNDHVNRILEENKNRLGGVQTLLILSAKWINDYNTARQKDSRDQLDSWMAVINNSLKKGRAQS